jgi:hypothetical protein
MVPTSQISD